MVGIVRKRSRRLPKKVGYTGLSPVQPQQQGQRGAYKAPTPTSRESIRRGPAQEEQNTGGLLGNALAGKQAVDTIGGMYEGGKDLREGFSGLSKAYDKTTDYLGDTWNNSMLGEATSGLNMPSIDMPNIDMPSFDMSMPEFLGGSASPEITSLGSNLPTMGNSASVGANSVYTGGASDMFTGSEGAMADGATTGLQSGTSMSQALPYLNIGKDFIMGSDNLTGNRFGDTALRGGLAYATGGLSELGYAVGDMFDWW